MTTIDRTETVTTTSDIHSVGPAQIRSTGIALAAGTGAWVVGLLAMADHEGFGWQSLVGGVGALAFQLSIARLLWLQYRTHAMGSGKVAKGFHIAQFVFLAGALVSTTLDAFWLIHGTAVWAIFDACWPLSMAGMVGIGIRIAIAGRWTGLVRWYTLWAQSWFVMSIPLVMIVRDAGQISAAVHLIAGYLVLGVILARRASVN